MINTYALQHIFLCGASPRYRYRKATCTGQLLLPLKVGILRRRKRLRFDHRRDCAEGGYMTGTSSPLIKADLLLRVSLVALT